MSKKRKLEEDNDVDEDAPPPKKSKSDETAVSKEHNSENSNQRSLEDIKQIMEFDPENCGSVAAVYAKMQEISQILFDELILVTRNRYV